MLFLLSRTLFLWISHPLTPVNPLGLSLNAASSRRESLTTPTPWWARYSSRVFPERSCASAKALVSLHPSSLFTGLSPSLTVRSARAGSCLLCSHWYPWHSACRPVELKQYVWKEGRRDGEKKKIDGREKGRKERREGGKEGRKENSLKYKQWNDNNEHLQ